MEKSLLEQVGRGDQVVYLKGEKNLGTSFKARAI